MRSKVRWWSRSWQFMVSLVFGFTLMKKIWGEYHNKDCISPALKKGPQSTGLKLTFSKDRYISMFAVYNGTQVHS